MAKHRRLGAVADHVQLRGVVRQTATVVATAITACILVAGLVTVVLAGLDSTKHPAPQAPPPPSGQAADGTDQSDDSPTWRRLRDPTSPTTRTRSGSRIRRPHPRIRRPGQRVPRDQRGTAPETLTPPAPSPSSSGPPSGDTSAPHSRHPRPTNHRTKTGRRKARTEPLRVTGPALPAAAAGNLANRRSHIGEIHDGRDHRREG